MPNQNQNSYSSPQDNYDPRWFIWTIVFLLVTGVALVSYIMLSSNTAADNDAGIIVHHQFSASTKK